MKLTDRPINPDEAAKARRLRVLGAVADFTRARRGRAAKRAGWSCRRRKRRKGVGQRKSSQSQRAGKKLERPVDRTQRPG